MAYPLLRISPSDVRIGARLRGAERDVTDLAESMASVGLLYPIHVLRESGKYKLIAGLHRLKAAKQLKWSDIPAYIFEGSELQAELLQIDENLIRKDLSAAERSQHLARRKSIYEAMHPDTKTGGAPGMAGGGKVAKNADSASFVADTAKKTGVAARTIAEDVQIGTRLADDVMEKVKASPLADEKTALLELSRLSHDDQREVVGVMERARGEVRQQVASDKANKAVAKRIREEIRQRQPKRQRREVDLLPRALAEFDRWADKWRQLPEIKPIVAARQRVG
ncbi:MAG: ParB/RepB/Spo0J family partition protein [Bradyrhizobium sp.]|uniref:ParB/RepB/Spo0J family partition protein n=1 Tax=Bradyrhizobium sp. TaxID=376 RepID=UPI003D0B8A28